MILSLSTRRKRATVRVDELREAVNTYLVNSATGSGEADQAMFRNMRLGACCVLETVLHSTDNYRGFSYLETSYGAGVTDESRRHYF